VVQKKELNHGGRGEEKNFNHGEHGVTRREEGKLDLTLIKRYCYIHGWFMEFGELTEKIIKCAMDVHTALGPGLLENAYKECLYYKLRKTGIAVEKEKGLPLIFEEVKLDCGYRIDLLVENSVVIELKSVKKIEDIHLAQALTYMKLGKYKVGLIINFNVTSLKDGIRRLAN